MKLSHRIWMQVKARKLAPEETTSSSTSEGS